MASRTVTPLPVQELPVADGNWNTDRKPISLIIIHTMDGTITSANARFNSPSQVSAHYGVGLDGRLVHWVDETNVAFHAGNYAVNQSSIGIEHEDGGNYNGIRPDVLYESSAKLVKDICSFYNLPIDRDHIKKHSEVDTMPGGTACPDALDIDRIVSIAKGGDDMLTPSQATDFYHIILNREPESPSAIQGRDAISFVYSAKTELDADRAAASKAISSAVAVATATLNSQVQTLTDQLAAKPKEVTTTVALPLGSYDTKALFNELVDRAFSLFSRKGVS